MQAIIKKTLFLSSLVFMSSTSSAANLATATFQVLMTITSSCHVSVGSDMNLGSVSSSTTNASSSNTLSVNCSKNTHFNIGLSPSATNNGTDAGAGNLVSTDDAATNTDKIPYQLKQTSATGANWGNTATASDAGNGVSGTGTGANQSFTVYAVVANANFTPDTYSDVVTVNVNY